MHWHGMHIFAVGTTCHILHWHGMPQFIGMAHLYLIALASDFYKFSHVLILASFPLYVLKMCRMLDLGISK